MQETESRNASNRINIEIGLEDFAALERIFNTLHLATNQQSDKERTNAHQTHNDTNNCTYNNIRNEGHRPIVTNRDVTLPKYWYACDCRFQERCKRGTECRFHHNGKQEFDQEQLRITNQPTRNHFRDQSYRPTKSIPPPPSTQAQVSVPTATFVNDNRGAEIEGDNLPPVQPPSQENGVVSVQKLTNAISNSESKNQAINQDAPKKTLDTSNQMRKQTQTLIQKLVEQSASNKRKAGLNRHWAAMDPAFPLLQDMPTSHQRSASSSLFRNETKRGKRRQ